MHVPLGAPSESSDESQWPIAGHIGRLVSFDAWRFGQVQGKTLVTFHFGPAGDRAAEVNRFFSCYRRQQRRLDPRAIAAVHDADYPHAVTMSLTAADGGDAMLVLLRTEASGEFTPYELQLLQLAKGLGEEMLHADVAEIGDARPDEILKRSRPTLFILDRDYRLVMGGRNHGAIDQAGEAPVLGSRLPAVLEQTVRELTPEWAADPTQPVDAAAMPLPFLLLRIHDMTSEDGHFLAVTVERTRRRNALLRAAKRFYITPREREVVTSLLDGARTDEIAERLCITVSTVNDHIKKLIERTGASNRSQMLARILGWQSPARGETEPS